MWENSYFLRSSFACRFISRVFLMPYFTKRSSWPRKMFSATVRPESVPSSCTMMEMPSSFASTWFFGWTSLPSRMNFPLSIV